MPDELLKQRLKSKTYWLGLLVMFLAYLQSNVALVSQYMGEHQNAILFLVGGAIPILREVTNGPLSDKTKSAK